MAKRPALVKDLEALCQTHSIDTAILCLPQENGEFMIIARACHANTLRQLGQTLLREFRPGSGPRLN